MSLASRPLALVSSAVVGLLAMPATAADRPASPDVAVSVTAGEVAALTKGHVVKPELESVRKEKTPSGRVEVDYEYQSETLTVASALNLETSAETAKQFFDDTAAELKATTGRSGLTQKSCPPSPALKKVLGWGGRGSCDVVWAGPVAVGMSLSVQRDERIYLLTVFAPNVEALVPKLLQVVEKKLPKLSAYAP